MSEIEKMERYIKRTKMAKHDSYQMNFMELVELANATAKIPIYVVCLAFNYGKAKGYRAAKAEVRR